MDLRTKENRSSTPAEGTPTSASINTPPSTNIPAHELIRQIGSGSYGVVWLARNAMGVYRAIKIVSRKSFSDERPFERELSGIQKFEPISRSHEGFVDVLQVGINREEGYFYYVMELGDDQSSGQRIDPENYNPKTLGKEISLHRRLAFQECLELGLAVSQSLAELHKHGLVHRDVKPSNIIFVNGIPKLADIGLVAEFHEAVSFVGTEGFIPPEGPGSPQADIFGLGKVLYEASTGKDRKEFPELPTMVETIPDRNSFMELNEVILHACKNDARQRYQSAWDMHADLLVLANGKSVRRLKLLEKRLSNLKRIAGLSFLVFALLGIIAFQVYNERQAVHDARQRQDISFGNSAVDGGDLLGALPYFADLVSVDARNSKHWDMHRFEFGTVLSQSPKLTDLWVEEIGVNSGQFSPDGRCVVIAQDRGAARIYDLQNRNTYLQPFGKSQGVASAAYSRDGRLIVTASENGWVCIWDVRTLKETCRWRYSKGILNARFSPDGLRVVAACADDKARICDAITGTTILTLEHPDCVRFAAFSQDGTLIVTCCNDHKARIWDSQTGALIGEPLEHDRWVYYAAFSPDKKRLITASGDHTARVWDLATFRQISPDLIHDDAVTSAEFSPDGRYILTASLDHTVRLWNASNFRPASPNATLRQHDRVTQATFDGDGRRILVSCSDGSVAIWDLAGQLRPNPLNELQLSNSGKKSFLITNNLVVVQNGTTNGSPLTLLKPSGLIARVKFNRNDAFLLITFSKQVNAEEPVRCLQVWNSETGKAVAPEIFIPDLFTNVSLTDDGTRAILTGGKNAQIWDVIKRTPLSPVIVHSASIESAFFSPDGRRAATLCGEFVYVCDVPSGIACFAPLGHDQKVMHAEFSDNGSNLATCCADPSYNKCYAQVWDSVTGRPIGSRLYHHDGVLFATFSPDGNRLATAGEDFSAVLWDVKTSKKIGEMRHKEKVSMLSFSLDGIMVITASADQTARIWNAENGNALTPALGHSIRVEYAHFLGSHEVVTHDALSNQFIWNLPVDQRSSSDLIALARLLSGDSIVMSEQPGSESPLSCWRRLKGKYPAEFETSTHEVEAWHRFEAEDAMANGQWDAAIFHFEQLLTMDPINKSWESMINQVRGRSKAAKK